MSKLKDLMCKIFGHEEYWQCYAYGYKEMGRRKPFQLAICYVCGRQREEVLS